MDEKMKTLVQLTKELIAEKQKRLAEIENEEMSLELEIDAAMEFLSTLNNPDGNSEDMTNLPPIKLKPRNPSRDKRPVKKVVRIKDPLKNLMKASKKPLSAAEARDNLQDQGFDTTYGAVRTALNRHVENGNAINEEGKFSWIGEK